MKNFLKVTFILIIGFIFVSYAFCKEEKPKYIQGIELLTGFGTGKLHAQDSYRLMPIFIDLNFDLRPLTEKIGFSPPGLLQFVEEPFISAVFTPYSNVEVGNNFLLKIGFLPLTSKLQPYFKGGLGFLYMSQHTREQATQFNFNEYGGIGTHYFFKKNVAFTVEYRFRHISNAGRKHPNHGVNTHFGLCGISYLF